MNNCKKCGQPTPSKTRLLCNNCLSSGTRASMHANTGKPLSVKHREKLSKAKLGNTNSKGAAMTDENKQKLSRRMKGISFFKGQTHSAAAKQKISNSLIGNTHTKGRKLSPGHRLKISRGNSGKTMSLAMKSKVAQAVVEGRAGFRLAKHAAYASKDGRIIHCRSLWEYKVAEYLDSQNVIWEYELDALILGDDVYIPDFFIFDEHGGLVKIVEVKGYYPPDSQAKMERCINELEAVNIPLELWDKSVLKELGIL